MSGGATAPSTSPRSERQAAVEQLRALAKPHRFRVQLDVEGFPLIPGRYGQIEWFDGKDLAVYTNRPRLFARLWAITGVRRHQTGDTEMRAVFPIGLMDQVAAVIRAKRWGGSGRGRRKLRDDDRTNDHFAAQGAAFAAKTLCWCLATI